MFGQRLKLARKRAGLSLRDLSDRLEQKVSAQAIGKYESGKMFPSSSVLVALGKSLDVDLDFLTSAQVADLCGVEFRKNAKTRAVDTARVEASVIDHVERYLAIEDVLQVASHSHELPPSNPIEIASFEEAEELANQLRVSWKLGTDPLPSVVRLLEERGIKVLALDLPRTFSGLTCEVKRQGDLPPIPVIVVSTGFSVERRRFTLCHELAHRVISGVKATLDHEKAMHRFASAFLMPADSIRAELGETRQAIAYEEFRRIKRIYGVSAAALLIRLRDLGILSANQCSYVFENQGKTWRTIEPDPLDPEGETGKAERPERFERLVYRALAERLISLPKAAALLRKPAHDVQIAIRGPSLPDAHRS